VQDALHAFGHLFEDTGGLTAFHWALIQNYLVKPAARLTPEQRAALPVSPDEGTGKHSHADTMRIRDMRRLHPVGIKLVALSRLLGGGVRRPKANS
jgi:hypothetical protein